MRTSAGSLRHALLTGSLMLIVVAADCHDEPISPPESAPAADVTGLWEFTGTMPGGVGAMEWRLDIQMSLDGRISGTAPWGQIVNYIGASPNPRLTLQDNRPVSGRVTGSRVELNFDALDTGEPRVFEGSLTSTTQMTGGGWLAERVR